MRFRAGLVGFHVNAGLETGGYALIRGLVVAVDHCASRSHGIAARSTSALVSGDI